jgi:hypothetical protein
LICRSLLTSSPPFLHPNTYENSKKNTSENIASVELCNSANMLCIPASYTAVPFQDDGLPLDELDMDNLEDFDPDAEMRRHEEILEHKLADLEAEPGMPVSGRGPIVSIGFDSEFVSGTKETGNTVLSLQFYLMGEAGTYSKVIYPKNDQKAGRPSFQKTITRLIIDAMESGAVLEWPSQVVICGFFLRIDLPAFADLAYFKNQLDSAGGRISSVRPGVEIQLEPEEFASLLKRRSFITGDADGFCRSMPVRFIDVGSHVAVGTSLAQMGDLIGLPKLLIPDGYSIERMDELLQGDKKSFEEYGLRDSEIAVRYFLKLQKFSHQETGSSILPATASGLAVKIFISQLKEQGIDFNQAFGVKETLSTYWNVAKGSLVTAKEKELSDMRAIFEPFVANCYSGGRNECYAGGPTAVGVWNDFDLAGAYTTGLVDLRHIDYDNFRMSRNAADYVGHVLGFAYLQFSFPSDTKYPCLPVRSDRGLFYPLQGISYCSAPEIEVALSLGCQIDIRYGIIIPWRKGDARLFEPFVTGIRALRKKYKKGSLDELYAKLLGNSLYGKTAQGLKKKKVFDTRGMRSIELPHSKLTNAAIAAHTTGFIRAVLSEQIAGIPVNRTVVSATTDGFITDADIDELNLEGPMSKRFQALCDRVSPGSSMLEMKHRVRQVIAMKTRGQITSLIHDDDPAILAKAGISPSVPADQHNDYMVELYLNRSPGDLTQAKPFTSIREQWSKDVDVVRSTRDKVLNLEFDFKRRPIKPTMIRVNDCEHLAFDTQPWNSLQEAERARAIFDGWRRRHCLKNLSDWEDWNEHYSFSLVRDTLQAKGDRSVGVRATSKGLTDVLRRLFLRAYTQGLCGLSKSMTYNELAEWLTGHGYSTTSDEVKNAKRAKFVEKVVPATERVKQFTSLLIAGFPSIQIERFLAND